MLQNLDRIVKALSGPVFVVVAVAAAAHAEVPVSVARDNHLVVPAYVNASGPYPFILDTGADESAVYAWFAKELKLQPGQSEELSGQTGTATTPMYQLKSLSIDRKAITNARAYGLPNRHDAGEEAGVAGNDLMDGSIAVFDFPCQSVALHPKPVDLTSILPKDAVGVNAGTIADGTLLTLPIEMNGVRGVAFLDTGSRDTRISPTYAAAAGVDPSSATFHDGDPIFGANSKAASSRIGPVGQIRFAGVVVPNAVIRVLDLPAFRSAGVGDHVVILGTDLMQSSRLVYDHDAKRVWFGSSKCRN